MHAFTFALRRIPYWAYLLVFLVIVVNTIYFINRYKASTAGFSFEFEKGRCLINSIRNEGPADKAGLQKGDIILMIDADTVYDGFNMLNVYDYSNAGDTLILTIQRGKGQIKTPVKLGSIISEVPGFYQALYIILIIICLSSLYILYKKPGDLSVKMFFIYFQTFLIMTNGRHMFYQDPFANFANIIFLFSGTLSGAILVHFHLLFPRKALIYKKLKHLPKLFYSISILFSIIYTAWYFLTVYHFTIEYDSFFSILDLSGLIIMTFYFVFALFIAVYQMITIKNTLARNQLRIVIIGTAFVLITPLTFAFAYDFVLHLQALYPFIADFSTGLGGLFMILCILIAIFRYRIWDIEVFIRKALLYLGATMIIVLTYLFLIWIIDRLIISENNFVRFLILGVSVIIFLVLRDRIQRLIDRLFHRETYDSATVVSDFEAKLAGIYRFDELKQKIVQSMDEIFHFKSFVFNLKTKEFSYEPVFVFGLDDQRITGEFEGNEELEKKLRKSNIFSPEELNVKPSIFEKIDGELIVPLLAGDQPNGFFICGQKRSERVYSLQDINVLALLARRVIALLHTANLYQKDLDRQLMLERERARISQDMHDDIGAGLTKIAMISEAPVKMQDAGCKMQDTRCKILQTVDCRLPTCYRTD